MLLDVLIGSARDGDVERIRCVRIDVLSTSSSGDKDALALLKLDRPSRNASAIADIGNDPAAFGPAQGRTIADSLRSAGLLGEASADELKTMIPRTATTPRTLVSAAENYGWWICWISPKCHPPQGKHFPR